MCRPVKTLSILSLIFVGVSFFLAFLFLTFLWEPVSRSFSTPAEVLSIGPVVPVGYILTIVIYSLFAVLLVANQRLSRNLAVEIIIIISLFAMPFLSSLLSTLQSAFVGAYGSSYMHAQSITNSVLIVPMRLVSFSYILILVVTGMRISEKIRFRNQYNPQR